MHVEINIEIKEVLFDIRNKAHLTGRSRSMSGTGKEEASNMQADEREEDTYQLKRSLAQSEERLKALMSEYIKTFEETTCNRIQDEVEHEDVLNLELDLPNNFNASVIGILTASIHSFLVNETLADWFLITVPNEAATYAKKAEEDAATIQNALFKRSRPKLPKWLTEYDVL